MLLLTTLAAAALAPPACEGPQRLCKEVARADAELARVKAGLPAAIAGMSDQGLDRTADDLRAWTSAATGLVDLWAAYRDARCDARLLGYETARPASADAAACRLRITRTAMADFRLRYGPDTKGPGRRDVEEQAAAPAPTAEEDGPCAHAPPAECDYCGMNRCWDARLKRDDRGLNDAWRAALLRIRRHAALTAAARADWTERLHKSQRLWLRWRDADCELERLETPNPSAHSIYALVTGPCLARETEARAAWLKRTYGR
jgi:uncharacterized protein YecT (DUF1311 family)